MDESTTSGGSDASARAVTPAAESSASAAPSAATSSSSPGATAPDPVPARGPLSEPYRWLSFGMFSMIFLAGFEALAVTTVMPLVARDLDGEALFAVAFAVPLAAGIIGMVLAGNWTDRSGPLPSLLTAAVLFAVGLLIAGTATNMVVFIVGRLVHGLAGAAVIVPLYVIVGRVYPEALRGRVFAGFAAAWVIPSLIGPAIAGFIGETISWHWVFLGVIGLLLPAAGMMLPPLIRARDRVQGDAGVPWSLQRAGWSVLTAGAALALSLSRVFPEPWRWVVAAAAIGTAVFAVRPLLPVGTLHAARGMPTVVLLRLIVGGAFLGSEIYLPYLLIERYELTPSIAGAVLTGAGLSWAFASWLQGRLGDRVSNTLAVQIGASLLTVALVAVLLVAAFSLSPVIAFAAWTIAGGGMGFMYPRHSVAVLKLSPVSAQGFNSAALSIGESLGASVVLALTALVSSAVAGAVAGGAFAAAFAVTVVIAGFAVILAPRMRLRAGEAATAK